MKQQLKVLKKTIQTKLISIKLKLISIDLKLQKKKGKYKINKTKKVNKFKYLRRS